PTTSCRCAPSADSWAARCTGKEAGSRLQNQPTSQLASSATPSRASRLRARKRRGRGCGSGAAAPLSRFFQSSMACSLLQGGGCEPLYREPSHPAGRTLWERPASRDCHQDDIGCRRPVSKDAETAMRLKLLTPAITLIM